MLNFIGAFPFHAEESLYRVSLLILALLVPGLATAARADEKIGYNQYIRPILSDNCYYCHGPDKNHRKKKLRLDDREVAIDKGAIVPGKPDDSELVKRILSTDDDELMPPPHTHKILSAAQKDLLKKWIAQGAEYQPHWAYITPNRPPLPAVKNASWSHNPIDAFILHELESRNLAPSHEAGRAQLLRRLSLDLIGLPPTPPSWPISSPTNLPTRTTSKSIASWPRHISASAWPFPGSTPSDSPTPSGFTAIKTKTSSPIAITSSTPSTTTNLSTNSPSSKSPGTCSPTPPPSSASLPASTAST